MNDPSPAIFLSYASQDAAAAKRMADALRAAGIEVWFDQNELVGGDAWDQKIRGQISSCALFVPIISANTQARLEGYFRREWKQAAARTHDMADEKTFLLPVVLDDTRDATAKVPPEFKAVQWTRLPGGETPATFVTRVRKLLSAESDDTRPTPETAGHPSSSARRPPPTVPRQNRLWWLAPIFGVVMALLLVLREKSSAPSPSAVGSAPAVSSVDGLVAKARALLDDDPLMTRANVELAEQLGLEALAKEPMNAEANALVAWTNFQFLFENYDRSPQRLADLKKYADKALLLAPDSVNAELAACGVLVIAGEYDEAFRRLQGLADRAPGNLLVLRTWAWTTIWGRGATWGAGRDDEHPAMARLRAVSPVGRAYADSFSAARAWGRGNYAEADRLLDGVFALGYPTRLTYLVRLLVLTFGWGDLPAAQKFAKTIPAKLLLEDVFINHVSTLWLYAGENEQALSVLDRASRPMLHEARVVTPTAELRARALGAAGRSASAALQWKEVLKMVAQQLEGAQDNGDLRASRVVALARLGDLAGARQEFALVEELRKALPGNRAWGTNFDLAAEIGDLDGAVARLDRAIVADNPRWPNAYNSVRYDPGLAALRTDGRVRQIMARAEQWLAQKRAEPVAGDAASAKPATDSAGTAKPPDEKSVAVLAFKNLSDDKANEYFSDGISEELLNVLAKVPGLKVSARTSAFYFKGKEVPVPEIAKQLGVAYVVEGSVRKAGDKVRITAQLIKADGGFHVWSDNFDRDLKDIFAVQDEIAGLIAKNLRLRLVAASQGAVDPALYERLLEARAAAARENNQDWRRAVGLYQDIVARNPRSAAAWGELARVYVQLARFGGMSMGEGMREARRAAQQALEIDPALPIGHVALGWVQRTADWDWRGALRSFNRARELAPDDPTIMGDAAVLLLNIGQIDEALRLARKGGSLDPMNPRAQASLGYVLALAGRSEEALTPIRRAIELAPAMDEAHSHLARALLRLGRINEADQAAAQEPHDAYRWNVQSLILARQGHTGESNRIFDQFIAKYRDEMPGYIAVSCAMRGQVDQAFEWIERAVAARDSSIPWFKTNTYLESLRPDPRWEKFLRRLGLADDQLK